MDIQEAFDAGFDAVRGYVDRSLAAQAKRMAAVERQNAELIEKVTLLAGKIAALETLPGEMATEIAIVDRKAAAVLDLRKDIEAVHKSIDALPRPDVAGMIAEALAKSDAQTKSDLGMLIKAEVITQLADERMKAHEATQKAVGEHRAQIAALVEESVRRAVEALPAPENGKDGHNGADGAPGAAGKDADPEQVAALVKQEAERILGGWERPANGKVGEKGEPGASGVGLADALIDRDGNLVITTTDGRKQVLGQVVAKDADMALIKGMIESMTEKAAAAAVAALPLPKDGKDGQDGIAGRDGKDAEPVTRDQIVEAVRSTDAVSVAVQQYLETNPPAAGKDGAPGRDGIDGKDGRDGEKGDPGPAGEKGDRGDIGPQGDVGPAGPSGEKGLRGDPGEKGDRGEPGADGRNGLDAVKFLRGEKGNLLVTMSNGDVYDLGEIDGKDGRDGVDGHDGAAGKDGRDGLDGQKGADGKNGADGLGFDDIEEVREDEGRFLTRRFLRGGELVKEIRHQTREPIWRGVFNAERPYLPGDVATWKGSMWHCNKDVTGKIGSESWSLAVKSGRDGKDFGKE